jgi:protein-S-isoprenylcysteine O-methyltransferase Ste14
MTDATSPDRSRGPGVRIPPPLLFLFPMAMGFLVHYIVPIGIVTGVRPARTLRLVGWAEILIGLALNVWAVRTFNRLQTTVIPRRPARALAAEGPYRITRNPMYLGFAVIYLGVSFAANSFWVLLFLPEAIVFVSLFAIKLEEAYLRREFGTAYDDYCARVRRWI